MNIHKSRIPDQLSISITSRCLAHCPMCHFWHQYDSTDKSLDIPLDKILQAIAHYDVLRCYTFDKSKKNYHKINITGGEPLMRFNDVVQIAALCKKISMPMILLTNGILLNEKNMASILDNNLYHIVFSVEHYDENINDYLRGFQGHYAHIHAVLPMVKKYIADHGLQTLVGTNTVIVKQNYKDLAQISKHYKTLGADYCTTQFLDTHVDLSKGAPHFNDAYDNMFEFCIDAALKITGRNKILQSGIVPNTCGAKEKRITVIKEDGGIAPCYHFLIGSKEKQDKMKHMNIKTMSLLEYFDDSNYSYIENELQKCDPSLCKGCHLRCYT